MKPCPFCGSLSISLWYEVKTLKGTYVAWAYCEDCAAQGPEVVVHCLTNEDAKAAAMGAWNVRNNELVKDEVVNDLPAT